MVNINIIIITKIIAIIIAVIDRRFQLNIFLAIDYMPYKKDAGNSHRNVASLWALGHDNPVIEISIESKELTPVLLLYVRWVLFIDFVYVGRISYLVSHIFVTSIIHVWQICSRLLPSTSDQLL